MRLKTISKVVSATLSAAMLITSVPSVLPAEPVEVVGTEEQENLLKLWYDEPASQGVNILSAGSYNPSEEDNNWQQHTLPIGNSFMGANVYGEIAKERLTFNQKTLWNGGPSESRPDYDGGNIDKASVWQETVSAFLVGDDEKGSSLAGSLTGEGESGGYGVYQSWGDIYLEYKDLANVTQTTDYERNLDLTTGIANVDFAVDGTEYHREYFVSYPDNVLAMKLTSSSNSGMNLNVSFPIDNGETASEEGSLTNAKLGKENIEYDVDVQAGTIVNTASLQDNQMKMNSVLKVVTDKGTLAEGSDKKSLDVSGASEIVIFISANTDYKNDYPTYRTGETAAQLAARVKKTVDSAAERGYAKVKSRYLDDYQDLFGRVDLDLGQAASNKTTDQLLAAYKASGANEATDSEKRLLEVLLYQFGRYLTIASSRDGDLPSNLQGVWQNRVGNSGKVPWGSDFHMNVNLQMNYWPTYSANLAECATPIIDYVNSLREPGRVTAEMYFGIKSEPGEANGFSAHTQNTPFGWTCPGWAFNWGWSPAAVPWILQNCWEYYEYTGDLEYMRTNIYPMMKEETLLYDQILLDSGREITLADGTKSTRLVSAPAYSSEHGPRTLGNAYENVLIWQLYEDTITAAELLGVDSDLVERWKVIQERLSPIEIGNSGQIKEWYNEGEYGKTETGESISGFEADHRHMSHMLGLFPGDLVSVENEEYIDAAIVTLDKRGYSSTGWGMGQRINAWARTGDGNTAFQVIQNLIKGDGKGGIYPNLWDTHPPFQIDGNFGYTSGVNEMLMQSNVGYINILAALPDAWSSGSVNGIVARGNFEIGIDWTDGKATEIQILSNNGGECIVQYAGIETATIQDSKGQTVTSTPVEGKYGRISFNTVKGETYTITGIGEDTRLAAPENTTAVKSDASGVSLKWDAVEGADSYNVYARVDTTTTKLNDSAVTDTAFKDTASYDDASVVDYMVAAVKDGSEGFRSDKFKLLPLIYPNKAEVIDETDSRIKYTGSWSSYPETGNYGGTMKFLQSAKGNEAVELQFYGTGVEILASKSSGAYDAQWKVYIDGEVAGIADCQSDTRLWQQVVFSKQDLSDDVHTVKLTTEENAGKKIEIDAFVVYAEQDANATVTYDLGDATGTVPSSQSGAVRSTIQLASCTVPGFQYWTDGSKTYQAGEDYVLHKDVTMTAVIGEDETNPPTGITVSSETIELTPGEIKDLGAAIVPDNAGNKNMTYKSSDLMVATVSPNGIVTASKYKSGTATITITSSAVPTLTKTVTVTVRDPMPVAVTSISLEKERIALKVGNKTTVSASIEPYFGTDKTVTWSIDDDSVATVTNGVITAVGNGKAVITVTSSNNISASCTVWVSDMSEEVDASSLEDKISELENEYGDLSSYTQTSAEPYRKALEDAKKVLSYRDFTQAEVEEALAALAALNSIVLVQRGDSTALEALINEAEKIDLSGYTEDSAAKFTLALDAAKEILSDLDALQADVDGAWKDLNEAQTNLVAKDSETEDDPKGTENGTKPVPALNTLIEDANLQYRVTKSDAVNGTVAVTAVTAAGKKKSTITIPATVKKDGYTFKVTAINKNVFKSCKKKLKSIVIGENVTNIGANSFKKCTKLKSIRFMSSTAPTTIGKNAFKGIKSTCKIYYPKSMSKSALKKLKKKMKSAGKKVTYKKK